MEHKKHTIDDQSIERFSDTLKMLERSETTISKYIRDVRAFRNWLGEDGTFDKERVMQYKDHLQKEYRINSTNSMISALNTFFKHMEWEDCRVSTLKVQRSSFRSAERHLSNDEFGRLLAAAGKMGNEQLVHIMETIAGTGIRISELPFITVECLRERRTLVAWCRKKEIRSGSIFVTRNGSPLDRSNILHMMKSAAKEAGVLASKVFPHNLRHLFAVNYYEREKDIVRLADLLGHSNINTTRIYTMTTCEKELSALNKIGKALILSP